MAESVLDPIDDFVRFVRKIAADNQHVIVGPVSCSGAENHYLIEIVVAAIDATPDRPFATTVYNFEVEAAGDDNTDTPAWDTWSFLAKLLERDFQSVEKCGGALDFSRAVEKRWPCPEATAAREKFELRDRRRQEWDARRVAYIAKRDREGAEPGDAFLEFLKLDPPDYY